jgi:hypothetical protein
MTQSTNALLVFCEGQHDVAYVRMLLQEILEFEKIRVACLAFNNGSNAVLL